MLLRQMMHLTTGTFLSVRNSLLISISSNITGHPEYSSHLVFMSDKREATADSSRPLGFLTPSTGGDKGYPEINQTHHLIIMLVNEIWNF